MRVSSNPTAKLIALTHLTAEVNEDKQSLHNFSFQPVDARSNAMLPVRAPLRTRRWQSPDRMTHPARLTNMLSFVLIGP